MVDTERVRARVRVYVRRGRGEQLRRNDTQESNGPLAFVRKANLISGFDFPQKPACDFVMVILKS